VAVNSAVKTVIKAIDLVTTSIATVTGASSLDLVVNMSVSANIKLAQASALTSGTVTFDYGQLTVVEL
jgi:hypothetical protein